MAVKRRQGEMRFDVAKLLTKNVISLDNSITLIGVHGILSSGTFCIGFSKPKIWQN